MTELVPPATTSEPVLQAYADTMINTFGTPKRVFVRGEGVHVWDAEGRRYTDLLSGLAVNALGHAHPTVLAAIIGQISTLGHVSNFFATPAQVTLAERLSGLAGNGARVFFANSGAEANEAAFKISRLTGRTKIIAAEGAFHGRTMGALAITHNPAYREAFAPLPGETEFVPYGDVEALRAAIDDSVAAVVLEPIQGENGVIVPAAGYLAAARELTERHGALLWIDEVQTGFGRTGDWFAHQHEGIVPDLITVAKGLGNGFPIGACLAMGPCADLLRPGLHGTTFGGNPVAAVAGLAVLGVIERDGLLARSREAGDRLAAELLGLDHPLLDSVRGRGLLRGVQLRAPIAAAVADAALEAGFIINAPRPDVIRIAPPLIIGDAELDDFVRVLPRLLEQTKAAA